MARKYQTPAHLFARQGRFTCARCGHPLKNARYKGEFLYPLTIVYLTCRCRTLNEVNINRYDPFYDVVTDIERVPSQASKVTAAPIEESAL